MKKNIRKLLVLEKPVYEFERFHSKTKIKKMPRKINSKFWPEEWKKVYYKGYARFDEINLPKPNIPPRFSLEKALRSRGSIREFSKKPATLKQLSSLFHYSVGISGTLSDYVPKRFYPSSGARYPIEAYLISLNTELPKGVYHYYVKNNSFERMFDFSKKQLKSFVNQPWIEEAGFLVVLTADFKRNTVKYGDRGYRYIISEGGHISQNFYLLASALEVGVCGVGGYVDDALNSILEVDGLNESVVYLLAGGSIRKQD